MKDALSSLDLHYLLRELQALVGARLDKAYQAAENRHDLLLQFRGQEKMMLRVLLPRALYLAEYKPRYGRFPGPFAVFLRKHIGNARCTRVAQRGFDRILELDFENKHGRFTLITELVPPGNMLLVNADGKIINLVEPQRLGARTLRGGAQYQPPPPQFNTLAAGRDAIVDRLSQSSADLVRSLATQLGLGGQYAEECCARFGFEKSARRLPRDELLRVADAVRELCALPLDARASETEATPFPFRFHPLPQAFPSFSRAIEQLITLGEDLAVEEALEQRERVRQTKAEKILAQQRAALEGLRRSARENQRKGELLYEHYQAVDELLRTIHELHREHDWATVKKLLPSRTPLKATVNESAGTVTIELDEQRGGTA